MIDLQEVVEEINKLEQGETTYPNCSKLAVLYSIIDHQEKPQKNSAINYSYGSSEFMTAASKVPIEHVLNVIDEHLEAVQLVYPKEYRAVINRIKNGSP